MSQSNEGESRRRQRQEQRRRLIEAECAPAAERIVRAGEPASAFEEQAEQQDEGSARIVRAGEPPPASFEEQAEQQDNSSARIEAPVMEHRQVDAASLMERRQRRREEARQRQVALADDPAGAGRGRPAARAPRDLAARRPTAFVQSASKLSRYTVVRVLGQGTFGVASLVRDERDGGLSVLKRIECESLEEANDALAEAAALASVHSARVLHLREHLLEIDERSGELCVCILTEYCAGGDLAVRIREARRLGLRFSERAVLVWIAQLCEGLAAVHAQGMIHRDLKPGNVLLLAPPELHGAGGPREGRDGLWLDDLCGGLLLADLGVASLRGCLGATTVAGSPAYMAPEVARAGAAEAEEGADEAGGERGPRRYGRAADLWSAGVLLVELCTRARPQLHKLPLRALPAATAECARSVRAAGYSAGLGELAAQLLRLEPAERPAAAQAHARALELLRQGGWAAEACSALLGARPGAAQPSSPSRAPAPRPEPPRAEASPRGGGGALCPAGLQLALLSSRGCAPAPGLPPGLGSAGRCVRLPAGEQSHLLTPCALALAQSDGQPCAGEPVAGRLELTSGHLLFRPDPPCRPAGAQAGRGVEAADARQPEPLALPLSQIRELRVLHVGPPAGPAAAGQLARAQPSADSGAILVRTADGSSFALSQIRSCTAVQLAINERLLALGEALEAPAPSHRWQELPPGPQPRWGTATLGPAAARGPGRLGQSPARPARSASAGAVREPGLGQVIELGALGIARAGADAAEACAVM